MASLVLPRKGGVPLIVARCRSCFTVTPIVWMSTTTQAAVVVAAAATTRLTINYAPFFSNDGIIRHNISSSSSLLPLQVSHRSLSSSTSSSVRNENSDDVMGTDYDNDNGNGNDNDKHDSIKVGPVTKKLRALIAKGGIQADPHQLRDAKELDRLYHDLLSSTAPKTTAINSRHHPTNEVSSTSASASSPSFFSSLLSMLPSVSSSSSSSDNNNQYGTTSNRVTVNTSEGGTPTTRHGLRGCYTYGGVGCGKTFLMELFYHELDNDVHWSNDKQLIHYHKFMLDVHQFMHTVRKEQREQGRIDDDIIAPVVEHILSSGKLLCLDEFQVTDVADAMILKQVFERLWARGCVLVTTSNRPPHDLYLHGLQRDRFLPFIQELETNCVTISLMNDGTDYRMVISARDDDEGNNRNGDHHGISTSNQKEKTRAKKVYFCGKDYKKSIQKLFYVAAKGRPSNPNTLSTQGRKVKIPMACTSKSICMFPFEDLCQKALGAADYLVIGRHFSTVYVYGIPQMTVNELNPLRRFITFIDSMYEWKVRVLIQTNAPAVEEIFLCDDKESFQQDEVFAFDRTRSRLKEMSSRQYLSSQWLGSGNDDDKETDTKLDLDPSLSDQWFQLVHQQNPTTTTSNNADNNDLREFQRLFDEFDLNKDGVLDKSEIKLMMSSAFGYEPVDIVVNEMISSIDTDQNGVIDPDEFCAMLVEIKKHQRR